MFKFSDGINVDTSGKLRKLQLSDGLYVVGQGMAVPMKDDEAAETFLKEAENRLYSLSLDCNKTT
jgi:hypothetical protein